ncbi:hypothetical protein HDU87_003553 [Geranomyces variabilis]|uniref:C2H2-type domain-containing protein n=1 Tax=Geranomyces variabilis TaxID=109894 RepID=A0AAD5TM23_9FUNG|nr:hypothetical protein HDU87_003553 [Geranomyces variabilis]
MMAATTDSPWTWAAPSPRKRSRSQAGDNDDSDDSDLEVAAPQYTKYSKLKEPHFSSQTVVRCTLSPYCTSLPPFCSESDYEEHYANHHIRVCVECSRVMPTARILDLHLMECHDSYFAAARERYDMYECFVDGCPSRHRTSRHRDKHLVRVHRFPEDFYFLVVRNGQQRESLQSLHEERPGAPAVEGYFKKKRNERRAAQTKRKSEALTIEGSESMVLDDPDAVVTVDAASPASPLRPPSARKPRKRGPKKPKKKPDDPAHREASLPCDERLEEEMTTSPHQGAAAQRPDIQSTQRKPPPTEEMEGLISSFSQMEIPKVPQKITFGRTRQPWAFARAATKSKAKEQDGTASTTLPGTEALSSMDVV